MTSAVDNPCAAFGAAVRRLRQARGLSQEDFADLVGVHRTFIGGIERGERNPTLVTITRIASALEVPSSALMQAAEADFKNLLGSITE